MSLAGSSASSVAVLATADAARSSRAGVLGVYMELTKARLSSLVVLTAAAGFVLAVPAAIDWWRLLLTAVGTALAAGSASALNQVFEVHRDRRMLRTRSRPLPGGTMGMTHAFIAAVIMGNAGIWILALTVNLLAAVLALLTVVLYVAVYTPLKARSTLNTLVGAVCGAIPPMIGWVAATGSLDAGAFVLGAILFVWQLPHFLALAWLYREDYERGGFLMLPMLDRRGELTARVIVLSSLALIPLGLLVTMLGLAGWTAALAAVVLGLWAAWLALRFAIDRSDARARRVFLASIIYLPLLFGAFVLDRGPLRAFGPEVARSKDQTPLIASSAREQRPGTQGTKPPREGQANRSTGEHSSPW